MAQNGPGPMPASSSTRTPASGPRRDGPKDPEDSDGFAPDPGPPRAGFASGPGMLMYRYLRTYAAHVFPFH
jgi:hypothetical protein